jgi:hypothetical protein
MNNGLKIDDAFVLPLFDEIIGVKETDFSIQINPLGKGQHKLLMLSDCKTHDYFSDPEKQLLNGILDKGLKKSFDDIWFINTEKDNISFDVILNQLKPQTVIIWGCDSFMAKNNLRMDNHQQALLHGIGILKAQSLSEYLNDNVAKGKLWVAMKKMFFA